MEYFFSPRNAWKRVPIYIYIFRGEKSSRKKKDKEKRGRWKVDTALGISFVCLGMSMCRVLRASVVPTYICNAGRYTLLPQPRMNLEAVKISRCPLPPERSWPGG